MINARLNLQRGRGRRKRELRMKMIDQLAADDFMSCIGTAFRPAGTDLFLTLRTIDQRIFPGWEGAARKPFSLILRGPRHPVLPEGLHHIEISDGSVLPLYIIPILTGVGDHQDYQIVFN